MVNGMHSIYVFLCKLLKAAFDNIALLIGENSRGFCMQTLHIKNV